MCVLTALPIHCSPILFLPRAPLGLGVIVHPASSKLVNRKGVQGNIREISSDTLEFLILFFGKQHTMILRLGQLIPYNELLSVQMKGRVAQLSL